MVWVGRWEVVVADIAGSAGELWGAARQLGDLADQLRGGVVSLDHGVTAVVAAQVDAADWV